MTTIKLNILTDVRQKMRKGGTSYYECVAISNESKLTHVFLKEHTSSVRQQDCSYLIHNCKVGPKDASEDQLMVQILADTKIILCYCCSHRNTSFS